MNLNLTKKLFLKKSLALLMLLSGTLLPPIYISAGL